MFTSRAEYRLLLREENADSRLTEIGRGVGLVGDTAYLCFQEKAAAIKHEAARIRSIRVSATDAVQDCLRQRGSSPLREPVALVDLLRRPEVGYDFVAELFPATGKMPRGVVEEVEQSVKYEGYIARQNSQIAQFKKLENWRIPPDFEYRDLGSMRRESREKLDAARPVSLGQAARISGVSPADISALMVVLRGRTRDESRKSVAVEAV